MLTGLVGALALLCALPAVATAAPPVATETPGQIDAAFGHLGNGTVWADRGPDEFVVKVLRQTDGRIVTVAAVLDGTGQPLTQVTRYLPNGSVDTSFGNGGVFTPPVLGAGHVADAVLQPDGKIVVAGWTQTLTVPGGGVRQGFFAFRVRTNGTNDPSFVAAPANFGGGSLAEAFGVALGPSGTIVVAGRVNENIAIARYTSTGALDHTFSGDGLLTHDFHGDAQATDVAVQPDGRIVIGGVAANSSAGNPEAVLVARFDTNGTIDSSFGTGGRVALAAPLIAVTQLVLQGTRILVAGVDHAGNRALSRYNTNGTLDTTFGSGGTRVVQSSKRSFVTDLVLDGSGRVVVVGESTFADAPGGPPSTALFRYSANGAPDPSFGCFGSIATEMLGNGAGTTYSASEATAVVADGNDLVVGGLGLFANSSGDQQTDDFVARYHGNGSSTSGYGLLRGDGGTSAFGGAPACGSTAGLHLNQPIVGLAYDNAAPGNWTVASDGGVFTFGAAKFLGSMGAVKLNQPIVGMAATPDGKGYWLVARDGGIFSFGTARFFGSMGAVKLNKPVVGMTATKDGKGYWLVASDGGVFSFGSAKFAGSTGNIRLNKPVVGIAADPDGAGYWIVATDGGVFSFDATFKGSTGNIALAQPVVGIAADPDGSGYWMAARDGGLFAFDAKFNGSNGATPFPAGSPRSTIAIAATPPRLGPI